ncbi:MAG: SelB C-terminal domain-containing protein [Acidobacteriota bacterium]
MKSTSFDAALDFPAATIGPAGRASVVFQGQVRPAALAVHKTRKKEAVWALVTPDRPLDVRWMDAFDVRSEDGRTLGRGLVLDPAPSAEAKPSRRKELLERLALGEREMVLVLAELKGIRGLGEEDVAAFARLGRDRIEELARGLEEEGKVRILSFSPLVLVLQDSLDFLRRRITAFLAQYHKRHPGQAGAPLESLEKKFEVASNILQLALRSLAKEGKVSVNAGTAGIVDYRAPLSATDEKTLAEMESLFLKGAFGEVSLDDIRRQLRLSPVKLQTLLGVLMEQKKIVEGRDGFILHSRWLDEVVKKLRASGRKELTVAEFKALTGLTRKYAIPLLELLDEMGVTRRKGAVRDILK